MSTLTGSVLERDSEHHEPSQSEIEMVFDEVSKIELISDQRRI